MELLVQLVRSGDEGARELAKDSHLLSNALGSFLTDRYVGPVVRESYEN